MASVSTLTEPVAPPAAAREIPDSAMATGSDDEPEMTIADKFGGEEIPEEDETLTVDEAAALLGDGTQNKQEAKGSTNEH